MKAFAELVAAIDQTNKTNAKVEALEKYFSTAPDDDKVWALAILSGRRPRRTIRLSLLWQWTQEIAQFPQWLLDESYHIVGDFAETIAMLLPPASSSVSHSLSHYALLIYNLESLSDEKKREVITAEWDSMTYYERFVFIKLVTGGFRIGVSQSLVVKALSNLLKVDANAVAHRLMGNWSPLDTGFGQLLLEGEIETGLSKPYPFYLAYAIDTPVEDLGEPSLWQAEWKWDGIRGQLIKRNGELFAWSRGEELVTDKFPEFEALTHSIPDGTVIDGEILTFRDNAPLPFNTLQTRIGRKNISERNLKEAPVVLLAYDLLEINGQDIRTSPLSERRALLEDLVKKAGHPVLRISAPLEFTTWQELADLRNRSREFSSEGIMLKKLDSPYETGRKRGNWWKWKIDPLTIDAVLVYAQRGHGRRANLYTDYTFAVWDGDKLVPFTKAYSGLTDKEFLQVDAFIRKNTREKFGPVRSVTPELVFEIAFEGINASPRHKSGVALRFPRMARWRTDKKAEDADTLEHLKEMLRMYGGENIQPAGNSRNNKPGNNRFYE